MIFKDAFDGAGPSPETREKILRIGTAPKKRPGRYVRRLSGALAAAVLTAALLVCGAAAVFYGGGLQGWFSHYWEIMTKQPMSESQAALIDHLTQPIGLSQTADGVTVTVDSATVGDSCFFLLLRAEGINFDRKLGYTFDESTLVLGSEPAEGDVGGWGNDFLGLDESGAALFLLHVSYGSIYHPVTDRSPLPVELSLGGLREDSADHWATIDKGGWSFSFTLDRSLIQDAIELPDTVISVREDTTGELVEVPFRRIRLSNTGIYFEYLLGETDVDAFYPAVILKSGAEVNDGGGVGGLMGRGEMTRYNCSYNWSVPVDLDEAAAIRIGETEIPIP